MSGGSHPISGGGGGTGVDGRQVLGDEVMRDERRERGIPLTTAGRLGGEKRAAPCSALRLSLSWMNRRSAVLLRQSAKAKRMSAAIAAASSRSRRG